MPRTDDESFRVVRCAMLWVVGITLIFLFVWYAWEVLFLAFAGVLLAVVLRAIADWLENRTPLGPMGSFVAVVCGLVVLIALIAWFIVPRVVSQVDEMLHIIPQAVLQAKAKLSQTDSGRHLLDFFHRALMNFKFAPKIATLVHGIVDAAAAVLIVAVVGLYAAASPRDYFNGLLRLVPAEDREQVREVSREVAYTLKWWMLGQLIPMVVLGVGCMIGLWLLHVPLAFSLGLFTGVMIFVPYLGALLSEIPAVIVALAVSPMTAVYVVILYLGVHVLEGYVLTPLVQRRAVRLMPVLTILSQFFMFLVAGLLGVAIATPLTATGLVLIKRLYLHEKIEHHAGFGT